VVDIGGGSTEFIIGRNIQPIVLESLYMGCVSFSLRFFPDGRVDKPAMREAELAARRELQAIVVPYRDVGWDEAVGSSGTAKAIADVLEQNGYSVHGITRDGLERLRRELIAAGSAANLRLQGLRSDRLAVLPGGIAIMSAVFREFGLEQMNFSDGALRLGVLYDLLGRYHHEDMRQATVDNFMARYQVDASQASSVAQTALAHLHQLVPATRKEGHPDALTLAWAAQLHEIGVSVAHSSYHKHSAYILTHADMPGFSRRDQQRLACLVLAHRGKLERVQPLQGEAPEWTLIFCLRLAVLLHRARDGRLPIRCEPRFSSRGFRLKLDPAQLAEAPLTGAALREEAQQWAMVGGELTLSP
jgi:exopolyphosphatase/guanosine-5'-triphosphate,3'-diphosphate pyrophosphatase